MIRVRSVNEDVVINAGNSVVVPITSVIYPGPDVEQTLVIANQLYRYVSGSLAFSPVIMVQNLRSGLWFGGFGLFPFTMVSGDMSLFLANGIMDLRTGDVLRAHSSGLAGRVWVAVANGLTFRFGE